MRLIQATARRQRLASTVLLLLLVSIGGLAHLLVTVIDDRAVAPLPRRCVGALTSAPPQYAGRPPSSLSPLLGHPTAAAPLLVSFSADALSDGTAPAPESALQRLVRLETLRI
jgi:hypothetical protein